MLQISSRDSARNAIAALTNDEVSIVANSQTKPCSACGQVKPLAEFHKNARMAGGYRSACKPCVLAVNRASVLRHHEKRKAEKRAEYQAKRHTPEYQAYVKARQEATKEQKQAYDAARYKANAEENKRRVREWVENNRERRRAIVKNYGHRRRSRTKDGVSTADLAMWTKARPKKCYWCGVKCADDFHVDHYVPLARGGKHELSNLVIACPPCNRKKNAKDPLDYAREVGRLL